jgi:hypothetical protein
MPDCGQNKADFQEGAVRSSRPWHGLTRAQNKNGPVNARHILNIPRVAAASE